ncbi:ABC transporter ATP-binding protein [Naasia sp. SYSU D00057]|uniref:ABC transporter ATP-binding protein n=1 Tax=Naasia sp. SYSU D00057 TaxID=2817380 RepID=UPI001B303161|nr:ATP-binding cassette domain-containing protein [Naasia sp. SYSU D00057]
MIEVHHLTKRYGSTLAVDDVSFTVHPGRVTGFLGPNGAGKSTTIRSIVGLDRPTSGFATINGESFEDAAAPLHELGVLLDAGNRHPGRTARAHLRALAATHGIGDRRVDEVMELTGIDSVAGRRAGSFSLGMGQRLAIAGALLGDPQTLILDEPINGLDPDGVIWVRNLLKHLAAEGRTVFLSSHLMSEMAVTADHLIVIGRGRILADAPLQDVLARVEQSTVVVRTPEATALAHRLAGPGVTVTSTAADRLEVRGLEAADVAVSAMAGGIVLHELTTTTASLEDAYLAITHDALDYAASSLETAGR